MYLKSYKAYNNPKATWQDKFIAMVSLGSYSHSELQFHFGDSFSISGREGISRIKRIDYKADRWKTDKLQISLAEERKIFNHIKSIPPYRYDWFGAAFSIFRFCGFESKKKKFCSEVVADILRENCVNYKWLDKGCSYSPSKLQKSIATHNVNIERVTNAICLS